MGDRQGLREIVAYVMRSNGAWLVQFVGSLADDTPSDMQFDCASSLTVAKRVAREGAAVIGHEPAWRWSQDHTGRWTLEGFTPEGGVDDY